MLRDLNILACYYDYFIEGQKPPFPIDWGMELEEFLSAIHGDH